MRRDYAAGTAMAGFFGVLLTFISTVCVPAHVSESAATYLPGTGFPISGIGLIGYAMLIGWSMLFLRFSHSDSSLAKMIRLTHHLGIIAASIFTVFLINLAIERENGCPGCFMVYILNVILLVRLGMYFIKSRHDRQRTKTAQENAQPRSPRPC